MQAEIKRTFASFAVYNFRLYFIGQGISLCGTWMRMIALSWLVLQLTHSGTQLGLVVAAQFLPILLFGAFAGVIVDRLDNRRLLVVTQIILGLVSLSLGLLVISHSITLWMVYLLSVISGFTSTLDMPGRQTFVVQLVGEHLLKNAVTLNSTVVNAARIIGPSIAAILIATIGIGPCFLVDAGTFGAVIIALLLLRHDELQRVQPIIRAKGQLTAGLRYVRHTPALRATLLMMLIVGTFAYEFPVILPLFSSQTLHGNATTYALLTSAMGLGAVVGGLYSAGRGAAKHKQLLVAVVLFGLSLLLVALAPDLIISLLLMIVVGGLSVLFISLGNTTLQLTSVPQMRGRVMSLWSIAFQGTTPIGGPIIGAIADHSNPRVGLLVGGVSAIVAAVIGAVTFDTSLLQRGNIKPFFVDKI